MSSVLGNIYYISFLYITKLLSIGFPRGSKFKKKIKASAYFYDEL